MKIAVLLGGTSPERDVSLDSGKNIIEALKKIGHDVLEIDPGLSTKQLIAGLKIDSAKVDFLKDKSGLYNNIFLLKFLNVDLVFNGLHGGDGENGVIQTLLETLQIKYTGSGSTACMLAMDKEISKMLLL